MATIRFLLSIVSLDTLVPLTLGAILFPSFKRDLRILIYYLAVSMVYTLTVLIANPFISQSRIFEHWFLPVKVGMLYWLFAEWDERFRTERWLQWVVPAFLLVWVWEMFFFGAGGFTKVAKPLMCLLVMGGAALILFWGNDRFESTLLREPRFWIATGILVSAAGNFSLALVSEFMLKMGSPLLIYAYYFIPPVFSLLEAGFIIMGLLCHSRYHR